MTGNSRLQRDLCLPVAWEVPTPFLGPSYAIADRLLAHNILLLKLRPAQ